MCSKHLGADAVLAWPGAEIAVMGPDGAANIIFRDAIKKAPDPAAMRREKLEEYKAEFSNPYQAAKRGFVDDVIEPALTRVPAWRAPLQCSLPSRKPARRKSTGISRFKEV